MMAIVIVSHSYKIAEGVKELIHQMTDKDVKVFAIGGLNDHDIRTSFDRIVSPINNLKSDALCFYDIGSAGMNLDAAIEMYSGAYRIEAPIVEGSFLTGVGIKSGLKIDNVIAEVKLSS